ncbi:hypothetical protein QAD02_009756 [Eretmocerus hayati]|uniref:Uncharacterized protein n=1 Tax=Eretmocerus hayati TaxID=131215 RepID=A0ACC2NAB7_9HYME|nr:hypothetical protein QAD02_009756 [Eretmocerus hayati]
MPDQSHIVKSVIVVPERNTLNCELEHCEKLTSGPLLALRESASLKSTDFDKIANDKGLVALDIAIDILATPSESHQLTDNSCSSSHKSSLLTSEPDPQSSALPSQISQPDPVSDSQQINQISIAPVHSPDLASCKPKKKLNLVEYNARQKTATKKNWTKADCIREYANRESLKEARDLVIPKETLFSPIYRPKPSVREDSSPLPPQIPVCVHNNELAPENLEFEAVDAYPQISQEFNPAWGLGLNSPPKDSCATAPKDPTPLISPPPQFQDSFVTLDKNPQDEETNSISGSLPTIDTDPDYNHFPLFKKNQELFDRLARSPTPPQDSGNCTQLPTSSRTPKAPQISEICTQLSSHPHHPSPPSHGPEHTSSSSLPLVNCISLPSPSHQSSNSESSNSNSSTTSSSSDSSSSSTDSPSSESSNSDSLTTSSSSDSTDSPSSESSNSDSSSTSSSSDSDSSSDSSNDSPPSNPPSSSASSDSSSNSSSSTPSQPTPTKLEPQDTSSSKRLSSDFDWSKWDRCFPKE